MSHDALDLEALKTSVEKVLQGHHVAPLVEETSQTKRYTVRTNEATLLLFIGPRGIGSDLRK